MTESGGAVWSVVLSILSALSLNNVGMLFRSVGIKSGYVQRAKLTSHKSDDLTEAEVAAVESFNVCVYIATTCTKLIRGVVNVESVPRYLQLRNCSDRDHRFLEEILSELEGWDEDEFTN